MRKPLIFAGLFLATTSALSAAAIFGTISAQGKPLPQGVALKLDCSDASVSGVTDQFGSYSLKTAGGGDCRLSLSYKGATPSLKVTLYEKPSRYDLVVKEEGGKITIARK